MSKLLYLSASPLASRSFSTAVAEAFVESYRAAYPKDAIVRRDLFAENLPTFDGHKLTAKYAILNGQPHTAEQRKAWQAIEAVIEDFKSADKYVLSVPMWNFGIPYRLKQYFDVIVQPGYTFSFSPSEGFKGLVTGKPIFVVLARGGEYASGTEAAALDFQKPYVEGILRFIGFTDICSIVVEPTMMAGEEVARKKRKDAIERARQMAREF